MKITLNRPKQPVDGGRIYLVKVDGRNAAYLRAGETKQIEIPNGARTMTAHIDWAKSNPLDLTKLTEGGAVTVRNRMPGDVAIPFLPTLLMLVARRNYLKLETSL